MSTIAQLLGGTQSATIPLRPVQSYAVLPDATIERGTPYPFLEFQGRNRALALLTDLYDGDMTAFLERGVDGPRVYSNYFRRVSTAMADLMCIAPPTITGMEATEEFTAEFQEAIYDAVVNATTYGQAAFFVLDTGELLTLDSIEPSQLYPVDGGGSFLVAFDTSPDSRDGMPDGVVVTDIAPYGDVGQIVYGYQGDDAQGTIGELESSQILGRGAVITIPRPPVSGAWGVSMYCDLLPLVLDLADHMSGVSTVLAKHRKPKLATWINYDDLAEKGEEYDPTASTEAEKTKAGKKALRAELDDDILAMGSLKQKVEYITWNAQLDSSFKHQERLKAEINFLTGLVSILEAAGNIPSGVALRRMLIPLYASTRTLQDMIKNRSQLLLRVLQELRGEAPTAVVEWAHPFDVLDEAMGSQGIRPDVGGDDGASETNLEPETRDDEPAA